MLRLIFEHKFNWNAFTILRGMEGKEMSQDDWNRKEGNNSHDGVNEDGQCSEACWPKNDLCGRPAA